MKDNMGYDMIVKLVILGESSVGKTNLLLRYTKDEFDKESKATIGMDFLSTETIINDHKIIT